MKKRPNKLIIGVLIITILIFISFHGFADENSTFKRFQQVLYLVKNFYVEDISIDQLIEGAINGVVEELDPYSSYMSPDEYEEMQFEFEGHFGGIGIVITVKNKELTIVSPIKGTPGDKAGLQSGDVIYAINGELTAKMSQKKAVDLMRGEPGTEVELTVKREDEKEHLKINIIRDDIEIPYVESEIKQDNIGYVVVLQFINGVGEKVDKAVQELHKQGAKGIILDLRSNPGGLLTEAVAVTSCFIEEGPVVTVKQRGKEDKVLYRKDSIQPTSLPLVVLINGGSASASEIVSGAIKDYERGKLMGTGTFGKGTVQTVIPLNDDSALRLTTARYYTPDGNFIHELGIQPDIEVEYDSEAEQDNQLQEAIEFIDSVILAEEITSK